jgi:hypothetical protein
MRSVGLGRAGHTAQPIQHRSSQFGSPLFRLQTRRPQGQLGRRYERREYGSRHLSLRSRAPVLARVLEGLASLPVVVTGGAWRWHLHTAQLQFVYSDFAGTHIAGVDRSSASSAIVRIARITRSRSSCMIQWPLSPAKICSALESDLANLA